MLKAEVEVSVDLDTSGQEQCTEGPRHIQLQTFSSLRRLRINIFSYWKTFISLSVLSCWTTIQMYYGAHDCKVFISYSYINRSQASPELNIHFFTVASTSQWYFVANLSIITHVYPDCSLSLYVESHQGPLLHYGDVIMTTMASQITSLTVVYSTVYSDADQRKHQSSASLAFECGIHRDRWILRTKGQLRGKYYHLMTSSWRTWISFNPSTDK